MYLNPGSNLGCRLFFVWNGKTCFFSQSLKERNSNVKTLTEFFCYNPLPILLRAALSNVHSGARLWLGVQTIAPTFLRVSFKKTLIFPYETFLILRIQTN